MDKQCAYLEKAYSCLRNYSRTCTTRSQRTAGMLAFGGLDRVYRDYCLTDSRLRTEYVNHTSCLRKTRTRQDFCSRDLKVALTTFVEHGSYDKSMGRACCAFNQYRGCVNSAIRRECGKKTVLFLRKMMRTAVSRLPELICIDFSVRRSPVCRALPKPGTDLDDIEDEVKRKEPVFKLLPRLLPDPDDYD